MKPIQHLSVCLVKGMALAAWIVLPGCYTVLRESSDYYSEFDTRTKKTIVRDTLIVQNEWENDEAVSSDTETGEEVTTTGNKTVIINRFYTDPWFTARWGVLPPYYHPYWGWSVSFGWNTWLVYYDPYWYYPHWRSGYYWGWCCYPVDPWYPPYWWSGGSGGYSRYQRRNYGMRRYQINPVVTGGSGTIAGGQNTSASGTTRITDEQSNRRVYRDGSTSLSEPKEETSKVTRSGSQRKYKSGESTKTTGSKAQEKSLSTARRQYKNKENKDKQAPRENRIEQNSGSSARRSETEVRTDHSGRSGRDNHSGSSGRSGSERNSGSSNNSGRSNERPVRR